MQSPVVLPWSNDSLFVYLVPFFIEKDIRVTGILHLGAHICEEKKEYNQCGIADERILWIEGNKDLCEKNIENGIPNVYHALISDKEKDVTFHITNNFASSSLFPLQNHRIYYPHIVEEEARNGRTMSLQTFFKTHELDPSPYNVWVLDIQGGELDALHGAGSLLQSADVVITELNFETMYEGIPLAESVMQFLASQGFLLTHLKIWKKSWGDAVFVKQKFL